MFVYLTQGKVGSAGALCFEHETNEEAELINKIINLIATTGGLNFRPVIDEESPVCADDD